MLLNQWLTNSSLLSEERHIDPSSFSNPIFNLPWNSSSGSFTYSRRSKTYILVNSGCGCYVLLLLLRIFCLGHTRAVWPHPQVVWSRDWSPVGTGEGGDCVWWQCNEYEECDEVFLTDWRVIYPNTSQLQDSPVIIIHNYISWLCGNS